VVGAWTAQKCAVTQPACDFASTYIGDFELFDAARVDNEIAEDEIIEVALDRLARPLHQHFGMSSLIEEIGELEEHGDDRVGNKAAGGRNSDRRLARMRGKKAAAIGTMMPPITTPISRIARGHFSNTA
jgi:hypothetical protein